MVTTLKKHKPHYTDWVNKSESYTPNNLIQCVDAISLEASYPAPTYLVTADIGQKHVNNFHYSDFPVLGMRHAQLSNIEPVVALQDGEIPLVASSIGWIPYDEEIPFIRVNFQEPKSALEDTIDDAMEILLLPENWNEEGAKQVSKELFDSAIDFLKTYSVYLTKVYRIELDIPEINPVPDGTIDLSWRTKHARMIINIRNIDNVPHAFFYGDRYNNKMPVKGNTPVSEFSEGLAAWMKSLSA